MQVESLVQVALSVSMGVQWVATMDPRGLDPETFGNQGSSNQGKQNQGNQNQGNGGNPYSMHREATGFQNTNPGMNQTKFTGNGAEGAGGNTKADSFIHFYKEANTTDSAITRRAANSAMICGITCISLAFLSLVHASAMGIRRVNVVPYVILVATIVNGIRGLHATKYRWKAIIGIVLASIALLMQVVAFIIA